MSLLSLVKDASVKNASARRISQAGPDEIATYVAAVMDGLERYQSKQSLSLITAYACARDPEFVTYLAAFAYAMKLSVDEAVSAVLKELHQVVINDFGELENFSMLVETLFEPQFTLREKMDSVAKYSLADDNIAEGVQPIAA